MHKKLIPYSIRLLFVFLLIVIPIYSYAFETQGGDITGFDTRGGDITALDTHTFIVTREFAGEIKLYLCSVEDGRIFIKDSSSIPYMTMEHRDLSKPHGSEVPGNTESPIIKMVP